MDRSTAWIQKIEQYMEQCSGVTGYNTVQPGIDCIRVASA